MGSSERTGKKNWAKKGLKPSLPFLYFLETSHVSSIPVLKLTPITRLASQLVVRHEETANRDVEKRSKNSSIVDFMSYSETTLKKLFALSGNRCAFPGCQAPIVDDDSGIVVGEICHIKGKSPKGPRYDSQQSEAERNKYENLLLMCDPHNKIVDHKDTRHKFPVEVLRTMSRRLPLS